MKKISILSGPNKSVNRIISHGQTRLHIASRTGDYDVVVELLNARGGPDHSVILDAEDDDGKTALHEAVIYQHTHIARLLLNCGCNVDALKRADWTPLMLACQTAQEDMVDVLLAAGANPALVNKDDWTPFHLASRSGNLALMQTLWRASPESTKITSTNGRSPLHTACLHGNTIVVDWLIESAICDINIVDSCGNTALMEACKGDWVDIAQLFLSNNQYNKLLPMKNVSGFCAIHVAIMCDSIQCLTVLYPTCHHLLTSIGQSGCHIAVDACASKCITFLLNANEDFTVIDNNGMSPLSLISSSDVRDLLINIYPFCGLKSKKVYEFSLI